MAIKKFDTFALLDKSVSVSGLQPRDLLLHSQSYVSTFVSFFIYVLTSYVGKGSFQLYFWQVDTFSSSRCNYGAITSTTFAFAGTIRRFSSRPSLQLPEGNVRAEPPAESQQPHVGDLQPPDKRYRVTRESRLRKPATCGFLPFRYGLRLQRLKTRGWKSRRAAHRSPPIDD